MSSGEPYRGRSRKLVLAFDIGTTYSGISYCILDPGDVPKIICVSRYPAQEHVAGNIKIPSILYYDRQGVVKAVGAEALQPHIVEQAEEKEKGWVKVEWWKLHLRAKHFASSRVGGKDIPPHPRGKSAVEVLGDFMRYLFSCARTYITESHANGTLVWKSIENSIEFILTHPNGWEGPQQQQIRRAAVMAGLVPSGDEHAGRIHLLTEGEASLHFFVTHVLASDALSNIPLVSPGRLEDVEGSQGIVIIDAGGGAIDLSAYSVKLSPQREFKEIAPAECRLQGSVFTTQRTHAFLKAKLANSQYESSEIVQWMIGIFDKTTKLRFRDAGGQLKLTGEDVAKFFEPSIEAITDAFEKQRQAATKLKIRIKYAFLVGGYAASDFLFRRLREHRVFSDVHLCRPLSPVNKAVADGAVSSFIEPLVTSRTSRYTYGIGCYHRERENMQIVSPSGDILLPDAFQSILTKGVQTSEQQEFRQSFYREYDSHVDLIEVKESILVYRGDALEPCWMDKESARFSKLCTVVAVIAKSLKPRQTRGQGEYYRLDYDVILFFGLTELKAQIGWKEMGVEKRIPASIVYDD